MTILLLLIVLGAVVAIAWLLWLATEELRMTSAANVRATVMLAELREHSNRLEIKVRQFESQVDHNVASAPRFDES